MCRQITTFLWAITLVAAGSAIPTELAAQEECNPCHYCTQTSVYIGSDGVSTTNIRSAPSETCQSWCTDFGEDCGSFALADELTEPLLQGESPSVVSLVEDHADRLRYIPDRTMIVVLGDRACEGKWLFAFPVRQDEVDFVRESVALLEE